MNFVPCATQSPPGAISAVLACERFGSASRGERAYKAGHAYGLLLRTLHLCDTLTLDDFRRETLRALNHNERTHTLQRQIRCAGVGSRRGRRAEELIAQSGALSAGDEPGHGLEYSPDAGDARSVARGKVAISTRNSSPHHANGLRAHQFCRHLGLPNGALPVAFAALSPPAPTAISA